MQLLKINDPVGDWNPYVDGRNNVVDLCANYYILISNYPTYIFFLKNMN